MADPFEALADDLYGEPEEKPAEESEEAAEAEQASDDIGDDTPDAIDDADDSESDDPEDGESDDDADEQEESEDEQEDEDSEVPAAKIKVMIPDENGEDVEKELTPEEIRDGFMLRSMATRKAMESAEQVRIKEAEFNNNAQVMQQAHLDSLTQAQQILQQVANLPTNEQMMQYAAADPQAWIEAKQKHDHFAQVQNHMQQQIQAAQHKIQVEKDQKYREEYDAAWVELSSLGYKTPDEVGETYARAQELFGVSKETLERLDPGLVKALQVAVKAKTPAKPDKSKLLPKKTLIKTKQTKSKPPESKRDRDRDGRFKSGTASLQDLADSYDKR